MTSRFDRITADRQEKLAKLQALGVSPYPNRYCRSHNTAQAVKQLEKQENEAAEAISLTLGGRLVAMRNMGKLAFLDVRDSQGKIQFFCNKNEITPESIELLKLLDIGDTIGGRGTMVRSRTGEPSLYVKDITL